MAFQAILWDFGDTLCDERWMLSPLAGEPRWQETYLKVLSQADLVRRWDLGEVSSKDVATEVARHLDCSPSRILFHMQKCSRNIAFYPRVMGLAANLSIPQAIVTINSDIFTEVIVPNYDLARRFDAIVTSSQEGTINKADLCEIAVERLPGVPDTRQCVLIDNKIENIESWKQRGGVGIHFVDEVSFIEEWKQ